MLPAPPAAPSVLLRRKIARFASWRTPSATSSSIVAPGAKDGLSWISGLGQRRPSLELAVDDLVDPGVADVDEAARELLVVVDKSVTECEDVQASLSAALRNDRHMAATESIPDGTRAARLRARLFDQAGFLDQELCDARPERFRSGSSPRSGSGRLGVPGGVDAAQDRVAGAVVAVPDVGQEHEHEVALRVHPQPRPGRAAVA